jgi:hypothetical protein
VQEQLQVGNARMIGYAIGIAAAVAVILWKLVIR